MGSGICRFWHISLLSFGMIRHWWCRFLILLSQVVRQLSEVGERHREAGFPDDLARYHGVGAGYQLHDAAANVGLECHSPGQHDPWQVNIPILLMYLAHFHQHGFQAGFYGAMSPLHYTIGGLMKVRDEYDLDIEGTLEVLPESRVVSLSIVTKNFFWTTLL